EAGRREEVVEETWGTEETDSNLVDVYVNYLRKKVDSFSADKLIQTVRGTGYRLGRPAPLGNGMTVERGRPAALHTKPPERNIAGQAAAIAQPTVRALIHSAAPDPAQPLTSLPCHLETPTPHN